MTNFEKYHEEMIEKKYRAVKDGKPISCKSAGCSDSLPPHSARRNSQYPKAHIIPGLPSFFPPAAAVP